MKKVGSVLALLAVLGFGTAASAVQHDRGIFEIHECPSEALKIRLNQDNRSSKADLIKAIQIFADYNEMTFTPIKGARNEAVFAARIAYEDCRGACATGAGFTEVQYRLQNLKGAKVSCLDLQEGGGQEQSSGQAQDQKQEQKQEQQQEQKQEKEGGVSVGT